MTELDEARAERPVVYEIVDPKDALQRALSVRESELSDSFPSIQRPGPSYDQPSGEEMLEAELEAAVTAHFGGPLNRSLKRRAATTVLDPTETVIFAGARFAAAIDDIDDRKVAVNNFLKDSLKGTMFEDGRAAIGLAHIEESILFRAEQKLEMAAACLQITSPVDETIAASPVEDRYRLVKALSGLLIPEQPDETSEISSMTPLSEVINEYFALSESSTPQELKSQLEQGQFDRLIAQEVVEFLQTIDESERDALPNGMGRVARLVSYTQHSNPGLSAEERPAVMAANLEYWGRESLAYISEIRAGIVRDFTTYARRAQAVVGPLIDQSGSPSTDFGSAMNAYYAMALREIAHSPLHHATDRARAGVESRRRRRQAAHAASVAVQAQAECSSVPREPVILMAMSKDLETGYAPKAELSTEDLVDDYISKHASEKNFAEELRAILNHFTNGIDFSSGEASGIKKLKLGSLTVEGRAREVWEYKPIHASGVSLLSYRAKKFRMMFVRLDDNKVGVIAMFNRDKFNEIAKGLGLGTNGSNK